MYISTSSIADTSTAPPSLTVGPGATSTPYTLTVANGGTVYVRVKSVNANGKSSFSNQVTRLVQLPVFPGIPANVTFTITFS